MAKQLVQRRLAAILGAAAGGCHQDPGAAARHETFTFPAKVLLN